MEALLDLGNPKLGTREGGGGSHPNSFSDCREGKLAEESREASQQGWQPGEKCGLEGEWWTAGKSRHTRDVVIQSWSNPKSSSNVDGELG